MVLNMGPQHPSTHGCSVSSSIWRRDRVRCVPHLGYLHTGFEKTFEDKTTSASRSPTGWTTWRRSPITSPSPGGGELPGHRGAERAIPARDLVELQRICSHLVWLGTHSSDLGAVTPFWYTFRERDQIRPFRGALACMMTSYIRIGGLALDASRWIESCATSWRSFPRAWMTTRGCSRATSSRSAPGRGRAVGSGRDCVGCQRTVARASGVAHDLRGALLVHDRFEFDIPVGERGDARPLPRAHRGDARATGLSPRHWNTCPRATIRSRIGATPCRLASDQRSMEELIYHFKFVTEGIHPPAGEVYRPIEGPKGEIGFYLVSDGSPRPLRCRVRPPSFINLQALPKICEGRLVADLVAILGSIDIVLGEVDR